MPSRNEREERIKRIISREYRIFKEEELLSSLPRTLYEKMCNRAEKILKIKASGKTEKNLQEAIDFCHLNVTPAGTMSLTFLFFLLSIFSIISLASVGIIGIRILPSEITILLLVLSLFFTYYIYAYPFHLKRKYEVDASNDIVTMILYMAMYMRNVPSLEGAVKFSAENITGYLGYELRKMLWDVEVGNYLSMQEAILYYTKKWEKNREFIESIQLLITSQSQIGEKRLKMLDESVNLILQGTREKSKNFNQQLKMPVMIVHALGIILPVMGLVLFPIVAVFLGVGAMALFIGYDILLPLVLYFVIVRILEARPLTFSKIDISENPSVPPDGKFFLGNKAVKAWPFGLVVGLIIVSIGILMAYSEASFAAQEGLKFDGMWAAITITFGISLGLGLYYYLLSRTRLKVRNETRQVESEFAEALFQLGNQISGGSPIEISIERSMDRIGNLKIKNLFSKALNNMKVMGHTFSQAFFDEQYGAVKQYPSKMIKSVIHTIIESSKKGVKTAAQAMISVSNYLKGLHSTQEDVKEQLSDTINSLKFQVYFLSPMISGIIVTMALIIINILQQLHVQTQGLDITSGMTSLFAGVKITPFEFILVVGIYLIESAYIISMFLSQLESGDDKIGFYHSLSNSFIFGYIVFVVIFLFTYIMFAPLVTQLT